MFLSALVAVFFLSNHVSCDYAIIYVPSIAQTLLLNMQHSVWLEDAFDRARQLYLSYYRSIPKSLELSTAHKLKLAMLNGDERFIEPTPQLLENLTLESVRDAVMNQFVGDNIEVCNCCYLIFYVDITCEHGIVFHLNM